MTAKSDNQKADASPIEVFTNFLNKYKELFAALFCFVSGAIWVFEYFATKDELTMLRENTIKQTKIINCLLDRHGQFLEAEHELKSDQDELQETMIGLNSSSATQGRLTEFDVGNRTKFEQHKEELERRIAGAEKIIADARTAIMFRGCEQ
jgi:hypothetical protein